MLDETDSYTLFGHHNQDDTMQYGSPALKYLAYIFVLALGASPLLYFDPVHNPSHLPRYALFSILAGISLTYLAMHQWRSPSRVMWHPLQLLVIALLGLASVSSLWNVDHSNFLIEIVPFWGIVVFFLLATQIATAGNILLLAAVSVGAGAIAAMIGLLQNWGINPLGYRDGFVMGSTFMFKNHASLYFDLVLPVAFILVLYADKRSHQWAAAAALALLMGFILEAKTRGSWLGLAVAAMLLLWISWKEADGGTVRRLLKQRFLPIFCATVAALFISSLHGTIDDVLDRVTFENGQLDRSSAHRLYAYRNSLEMIKESPVLGTGYGSFRKAFRPYTNHPILIERSDEQNNFARLHSDPLQVFVELGIVGGLLSLMIFGYVLYMGWSLVKSTHEERETGLLATGLVLALVASGVHSLVDFPLHKPSSALQFWLWMGLLAGAYFRLRDLRIVPIGRSQASLAVLLGVAYLGISLVFYAHYLKGNWQLRNAIVAFEQRDCEGAKQLIDSSVDSFGLYFTEHGVRTQIYAICENDKERLFRVVNEEVAWDEFNTLALLTRGNLLLQAGLYREAEQDFRKVVAVLPHRPLGKIGVARALAAQGELERAEIYLARLATEHSENRDVLQLLEAVKRLRSSHG